MWNQGRLGKDTPCVVLKQTKKNPKTSGASPGGFTALPELPENVPGEFSTPARWHAAIYLMNNRRSILCPLLQLPCD